MINYIAFHYIICQCDTPLKYRMREELYFSND